MVRAQSKSSELVYSDPARTEKFGRRTEAGMYETRLRYHLADDAAREEVKARKHPPTPLEPVDLRAVARGLRDGSITRPAPEIGGAFYPARINLLYGSYTAGKTWVAMWAAVQEMERGGRTLMLDFEDDEVGFASRCLTMNDLLLDHVVYRSLPGPPNVTELKALIESEGATFVVIDSLGEALAASGYESNDEVDIATWAREVARPLLTCSTRPGVLLLDHLPKNGDGSKGPVGSFRKGATLNGAMYWLDNKVGFSRTQSGRSRLICTKDRGGTFASGQPVGDFHFEPGDDCLSVSLRTLRDEPENTARLDPLEQQIMQILRDAWALSGTEDENGKEIDGRLNKTRIRDRVTGYHNQAVTLALEVLVADGAVHVDNIARGKGDPLQLFRPHKGAAEDFEPEGVL